MSQVCKFCLEQVRMYYRSGTVDTAQAPVIRFVFTRQVAALCCVKWRHGRHLESVTSHRISDHVNRCVFSTFLSNVIPIGRGRPAKKKNNNMSSDLRSVPDLKKV